MARTQSRSWKPPGQLGGGILRFSEAQCFGVHTTKMHAVVNRGMGVH